MSRLWEHVERGVLLLPADTAPPRDLPPLVKISRGKRRGQRWERTELPRQAFNGRMEFGPRALGARSILGDARNPEMQAKMNIKIKFREGFRPFAPSVLRERVGDWFELDGDSPYMLLVAPVKQGRQIPMTAEQRGLWGIEMLNVPRSDIPAATHVDYSARVQTVTRDVNPAYYDLIAAFEALTGCPVIVNTSFNVRGEPIVCTPEDAYTCFMRTHIDVLVLGSYVLTKEAMKARPEDLKWQEQFQLD